MTQIDEPNLDEQIRSALRIAKHIAETGGDGLEERQVDEIKALIATQVQEARIDELKRFDRSSEEMTKLIPLKIGERLYELTKQEEQE